MLPSLRLQSAIVSCALFLACAGCPAADGNDADRSAGEATDALKRVQSVEVIASPVGPVVVLKVRDKSVPVFVDAVVAISIREALGGAAAPRPLSHDLMHTMLDALGAKVTQAVITLKDRIFYAELTVMIGDAKKTFDARASDAIALALRFRAPIYVDPALLDAAAIEPPPAEPKPNAT